MKFKKKKNDPHFYQTRNGSSLLILYHKTTIIKLLSQHNRIVICNSIHNRIKKLDISKLKVTQKIKFHYQRDTLTCGGNFERNDE